MKLQKILPDKRKRGRAVYRSDKQILKQVRKLGLMLALLIVTHSAAMVWLEGMTPWQGFWLTLTTLSTVGYGDLSAQTLAGQVATVLLMFLSAITLLTIIISDYVDYRIMRSERIRTGHWNWNMNDHVLIINAPKYNKESFFIRLVTQLREDEDYVDVPILLLNNDFTEGLPNALRALGVVHVTGTGSNDHDLQRAGYCEARHILVLARDEYNSDSDSMSFDVVYRLHEKQLSHKVLVECVEDSNRRRLKKYGIRSVLRPIRSYPEILVRALDAPGSEVVIEDMFTRHDDHPERFSIWLEGEKWADVVCAMVKYNVGTPMAYISKEGEVCVNPNGDENVHAQSLIIIVKSDAIPDQQDVDDAFQAYFNGHVEQV